MRAVLLLAGFTAVTAQIVLMRELMVVFEGNEISLGLMLASWLIWTAFGSSVLGRIGWGSARPRRLVAAIETLIAAAFPVTILVARAGKALLQPVPGEILGPGPALLAALATLSVFCSLSGWLFAAGSRLYASETGLPVADATGAVYLLEAIGSCAGGVVASLALIRYSTAIETAALVAFLNLAAAVSLVATARARRAAMAALALALAAFLAFGSRRVEAYSQALFWRGFHLVEVHNSVYGNLAVVETGGSRSVFENGFVLFTVPDPAEAEEAVHYALLEHPWPARVLLIGGGVNGSAAQALRHPSIERLDYVELDPAIIDLSGKHFPNEWTALAGDARVRTHNLDGRLFLRTTGERFDVIIVNLPDPHTAQLNRFYTLEFFREAAARLRAGGVLSLHLTGNENYISPELAEFLRCIAATLRAVFPEVAAIPGGTVHFSGARREGVLAAGAGALLARLRERRIQTEYVREYYLPFRMSADRMADLESQIRPRADTPLNRDFAPIAYYFDVALWSGQFHRGYRELFRWLAGVRFSWLAGATAFLGLALVAALRGNRRGAAPALCVAAMGFSQIGLEVLLLLAFQAVYGYVYHQLAIVIAGFMAGMALGSWEARRRAHEREDRLLLAALQLLAALSGLLLYVVFGSLAVVQNRWGILLASQGVFPVLAVLCGILGGYQFPIASRAYFKIGASARFSTGKNACATNPGVLYGLDLAGSCLGAVVFSLYLIPVFGFLRTAQLLAIANLAPAALAALSAYRAPQTPGP